MSSRKSAKTASAALTVKEATFGLLRAFGIKRVFGNPGSTELPFLSDWPDDIDYVLGLPGAVVPVAVHEGHPIGVQLIAGRYREDLALDAAAAIEKRAGALVPRLWEKMA